jgi:hypothetical protein
MWIIGESVDGQRTFVVNIETRAAFEVFDEDDDRGLLAPRSFAAPSGQSLVPIGATPLSMAKEAAAALEKYDARLEREFIEGEFDESN